MCVTIVVALTTTGYVLIMLPIMLLIFIYQLQTNNDNNYTNTRSYARIISITCDMLHYQLKIIVNELLAIRNYILPVIKDLCRY